MLQDHVILVDKNDNVIGSEEKLKAHQLGLLHRAFSILLFHENGAMLLHQRAIGKYHSEGLWTNTCCSHQRPNETTLDAGHRRLQEEMGIDAELSEVDSFLYKTEFSNGLVEHELDHILVGSFSGSPQPNSDEVKDWKYVNVEDLIDDISKNGEQYTSWFKIIIENHLEQILQHKTL